MHALVIEDEPMMALRVEDTLRDCGFSSFEFATSAEEAITAASSKCPDLITADVELAPGCGITAVQAICSERPIPVIFISGSAVQVRLRMPGHELVEKPFKAEDIKEAIQRVFARTITPHPASNGMKDG